MTDRPSLSKPVAIPSGRITRVARMGAMTAGVAGNMALGGLGALGRGERPDWRGLLLTPSNLHRVTNELARMRGAAMKLGQILSMDTGDVLPPELAEIMARLRAHADFMPPSQLKQVLNEAWPNDWLRQFAKFDVRPIAAASIGQVHRAQLKDGRDIAIKVQYPGVARSIDSDVANVASLVRLSGLIPPGFEIAPYIEEARKQLHAETDYLAEAEHLRHFASLLGGSDDFLLPELHDDWTTDTTLTMSYLESIPLEHAATLPQNVRDGLATRLIDLLMRELFDFRVMQTDPNFANFRYQAESNRIVLLDFGATRTLDAELVECYRDLLAAGLSRDRDALRSAALAIGFIAPATKDIHAERLLNMIAMVFDAVSEEETYDFADQGLTKRMNAEGMALAAEGFVPPPVPMDVVFLQRKFAGIFLIAANLRARVPLRRLLAKWVVK